MKDWLWTKLPAHSAHPNNQGHCATRADVALREQPVSGGEGSLSVRNNSKEEPQHLATP